MKLRTLLVLTGLIATSLASAQPPVQAAETPELAHVTYLRGSQAGRIDVHLDHNARITNPLISKGSVDVDAPGKGFAGFALVATNVVDREGFVLLGGRLPKVAGDRSFIDIGGDWFTFGASKTYGLKPGDYSLYLLPDDGQTTVKLVFDGLEGTTNLAPTRATDFETTVSANSSGLPIDNYHYTSSTGKLAGRGLVFASSWLTADAHAGTDADICFWRNGPRDPDSKLPNCGSTVITEPGNLWGSSGTIDYGPSANEVFKFFSSSWHPFSSGFDKPGLRYGTSTSIESMVPPSSIGSMSFWLTY